MQKDDILKSMTLQQFNIAPKNTNQIIVWQFTCSTLQNKLKWINALKTLTSNCYKQKKNVQKFFDIVNTKRQNPLLLAQPSMFPWRKESGKKWSSSETLRRSNLPKGLNNSSPKKMSSPKKIEKKNIFQSNSNTQITPTQNTMLQIKPKRISQNLLPEYIVEQQLQQSSPLPQKFFTNNTNIHQQELILVPIDNTEKENIAESSSSSFVNLMGKLQVEDTEHTIAKSVINNTVQIQKQQEKREQMVDKVDKQQNNTKNDTQEPIIQQKQLVMHQIKFDKINQPKSNVEKNEHEVPYFGEEVAIQIKLDNQELIYQSQEQQKESADERESERQYQDQQQYVQIKQQQQNVEIKLEQELKMEVTNNINNNINQIKSNTDQATQTSKIQHQIGDGYSFYQLIYLSHNRQCSFLEKIKAQKILNEIVGNFTKQAVHQFKQFVLSKSDQNKCSSKSSECKIDQGLTSLQIGNIKYKIGYVTTNIITKDGKQSIIYNQHAVKSLKSQMNAYNKLNQIIIQHIKNMNHNNSKKFFHDFSENLSLNETKINVEGKIIPQVDEFSSGENHPYYIKVPLDHLRVPLCNYVEYKGICALAYDVTYQNEQKQMENSLILNEWREVVRLFGFDSNCFQFKTIRINTEEYVVAHIVKANSELSIQKKKKHHNVTFQSPMSVGFLKKAKVQGASTSIQSILRYIKSVKTLQNTITFTYPKSQILATLQYCYLCKYLRKFYRAAHGQIDQLHFINLLLKGDKNISILFQTSGFEIQANKKQKCQVLGIFFQFLLYYLGISCNIDFENFEAFSRIPVLGIECKEKCLQENQKIIVKSVKIYPRVIGYDLSSSQLYESFSRLDKYIASNNKQLSEKALDFKESSYTQNPFQQEAYPWPVATSYLLSQAQFNFSQNDYISSIYKCKQFLAIMKFSPENNSPHFSPSNCIPIYFLMMQCYSKFSLEKLNQTLKQLIQSTVYNFGQNSSMMITVFCFIGLTFYGIKNYYQAEVFLLASIKIAQKLYINCKKLKISQLYLDLYKVLIAQNKVNEGNQFLNKAEKIIENRDNCQDKLKFILYLLEIQLKLQKSLENQQRLVSSLFKAQKLLKSDQTAIVIGIQLYSITYKVGIKYNKPLLCQKAISKLWDLDTNEKILAIQLAYKLVGKNYEGVISQCIELIQKCSISKEKSILMIEEKMKNYSTLSQMMKQVLAEQDKQLIIALLTLIPIDVIKFN